MPNMLTGPELYQMSDGALLNQVDRVDVFSEIEPNQKERIHSGPEKGGSCGGFMGDALMMPRPPMRRTWYFVDNGP